MSEKNSKEKKLEKEVEKLNKQLDTLMDRHLTMQAEYEKVTNVFEKAVIKHCDAIQQQQIEFTIEELLKGEESSIIL